MNYYLFIPLFFIILLIFPVFFKLRFSFNAFDNIGAIGIFLFGIKIFSFKFDFGINGFKLYMDEKIETVGYKFDGREAILMELFIIQIQEKTRLKSLQIHYNVGVDDAFKTAILCGYIDVLFNIIFARIKCLKPTASLFLGGNSAFNESVFQIAGLLKISISMLDIVYSFFKSVILLLKSKNNI